jgi:hypothetical protein
MIRPNYPRDHRDDDRSKPPRDVDLFDYADATFRTRKTAHEKAKPKKRRYRDAIELAVAAAGTDGMTAYELHVALSIPYSSVQSPMIDLVDLGRLRRTDRTRTTGYGGQAAVYVSALIREGRDNG